jgi:hypothetical protein
MLRLTEACLLELFVIIAEVARLGRAARRVGFRHQKDDGALLGEQILHAHFLILSFPSTHLRHARKASLRLGSSA